MIPVIEDPRLAEAVLRLVIAYDPECVYRFGSRVRDAADSGHDWDLLLVVPDDAVPERRRSRLGYERLWGTGVAADVVVCTRGYFDSRREVASSLPAMVSRTGVLLHGA